MTWSTRADVDSWTFEIKKSEQNPFLPVEERSEAFLNQQEACQQTKEKERQFQLRRERERERERENKEEL